MTIRFHPHAQERMKERGTNEQEVTVTVERGEAFEAKFGRIGFRKNFTFEEQWRGKFYKNKQVEAYTAQEGDDWLVISVITRYF